MNHRSLLVIAALATLAPHALHAGAGGSISGRVVVVKDRKAIDASKADAWVYLEAMPRPRRPRTRAIPPPERKIQQVKTQFKPRVLVVPVGTVVWFPNLDLQEHNVFSPTDPPGQFDLGRYNTDAKGKPHEFKDVAEVQIYCDIHKAMSARVKVVDSDFIVPVDKKGAFVITGVPAGTYKVHAWTHDSDEVLEQVVVTEGRMATTSELHIQQGQEPPHTRLDGQPYRPYP